MSNEMKVLVDDLKAFYIAMTESDITKVQSFCDSSKMTFNEALKKYDFAKSTSNVRLCNFGKTDTCRTASIWYAPKRYHDYGVRIEKSTLLNLMKADVNKFLLSNCYVGIETQETGKDNEFRFSFASLDSALEFFTTLQTNYRKFVADSNTTREVAESEMITA